MIFFENLILLSILDCLFIDDKNILGYSFGANLFEYDEVVIDNGDVSISLEEDGSSCLKGDLILLIKLLKFLFLFKILFFSIFLLLYIFECSILLLLVFNLMLSLLFELIISFLLEELLI